MDEHAVAGADVLGDGAQAVIGEAMDEGEVDDGVEQALPGRGHRVCTTWYTTSDRYALGVASEQPDAEWLELSTLAEPEAVESISEAFSQWGQGVAIEQPVVSSPDGDEVSLPTDVPVVVRTYLPLDDPELEARR